MQKGFAPIFILIAVLVVIILAVGYIFYYQFIDVNLLPGPIPTHSNNASAGIASSSASPDMTANWKTYTNNIYKYTFSYNEQTLQLGEYSDHLLEQAPEEGNYSYVYGCLPICEAYSSGPGIYAFENRKKWNLNTWLSSSAKSPIKDGDQLGNCINKDPRTKRISGTFQRRNSITLEFYLDKETVRMINEGTCSKDLILEGGGFQKWIVIENDNNIIAIQIITSSEEEKAQVDQILSTFKFTQ